MYIVKMIDKSETYYLKNLKMFGHPELTTDVTEAQSFMEHTMAAIAVFAMKNYNSKAKYEVIKNEKV